MENNKIALSELQVEKFKFIEKASIEIFSAGINENGRSISPSLAVGLAIDLINEIYNRKDLSEKNNYDIANKTKNLAG